MTERLNMDIKRKTYNEETIELLMLYVAVAITIMLFIPSEQI